MLKIGSWFFMLSTVCIENYSLAENCHIECMCSGSFMDCSSQSLDEIVFDKIENWTWIRSLSLAGNNLKQFPNLTGMPELVTLDLANNQIQTLKENSFDGIGDVQTLNISGNNLQFTQENGDLHHAAFEKLTSLRILRMKQSVQQPPDADYTFLQKLTQLKQLYISPHQTIPEDLELLTNLTKLSLGGEQCNLEGLAESSSIANLPLTHFSARNCGIKNISANFLRTLGTTIEVLDLSCNPLLHKFGDILEALEGSSIQSLILDFVNQNETTCGWNNIDASVLQPMEDTGLKALSIQANHIGSINTTIATVLRNLHDLQYIDISQNTFNGAGFDWTGSRSEQMSFWTNSNLWLASLKYIRLDAITQNYDCNDYDRTILDCSQDHELFENESHEWEHVSTRYYMHIDMFIALLQGLRDTTILEVVLESSSLSEQFRFFSLVQANNNYLEAIGKVCNFFGTERLSSAIMRWGQHMHLAPSLQRQLTNTSIKWFLEEACSNTSLLHGFLNEEYRQNYVNSGVIGHRYGFLPFNLTTMVMQNNQINSIAVICQNLTVLYNNLRVVQASGSNVGYLDCNTENLNFFETLECRDCNIHSFNPSSIQNIGLKKLDFRLNYLGEKLRLGDGLLSTFNNLEILLLGNQKDGIHEFQDPSIFQSLGNLTHLDISGNLLQHWNISVSSNTKLKYLNFSYNQIEYIDEVGQENLDFTHNISGLKIDMSGNPFNCACGGNKSNFIKWLLFSPVIRDKHRLRCFESQSQSLNTFLRQCTNQKHQHNGHNGLTASKLAIIIACSLVGVAIGLILLAAWFRRRIMRKLKRGQHNEEIYIFISFTPSFMDQVEALKDVLMKVGIVLMSRYFDGYSGDSQSGAVSKLVKDCSKCLLLISEDYFESIDTANEYRLLESAGMLNEMSTILIVTSPSLKLPETLESMKQRSKFIVWPSGPCSADGMKNMVLDIRRMAEYSGQSNDASINTYVELQEEVEDSIQSDAVP